MEALANQGVTGILGVVALLSARHVWRRETARADRLEAENRAMRERIEDKLLPALNTAAAQYVTIAKLLEDIRKERMRERRRDADR
jgi:hypothetical protein